MQDNDHPYDVGDTFPREGLQVTKSRLQELSGSSNRKGVPLIQKVAEPKKQKDVQEETAEKKPKNSKSKKTEEE